MEKKAGREVKSRGTRRRERPREEKRGSENIRKKRGREDSKRRERERESGWNNKPDHSPRDGVA